MPTGSFSGYRNVATNVPGIQNYLPTTTTAADYENGTVEILAEDRWNGKCWEESLTSVG